MDQNLDRRAAVFAALGEPVRLALVDRLVAGDASPGELAADVGLGSNLLAHHLSVLEDAGIIRRARSEGDRRRSYVHLRLDQPTVWAAAYSAVVVASPPTAAITAPPNEIVASIPLPPSASCSAPRSTPAK